jgi:hypothetical protein
MPDLVRLIPAEMDVVEEHELPQQPAPGHCSSLLGLAKAVVPAVCDDEVRSAILAFA